MFIQDWLALFLASLVVAFAVFMEITGWHTDGDCLARYQSGTRSLAAGVLLSTA